VPGLPGGYFENDDAVEELCSDDAMREGVLEIATAAAEFARQEQDRHRDTGRHTEAIYVGEPYLEDVDGVQMWRCDFGSTSSTWHLMEFGSYHNPAYRPLTAGAEAVGLDYQPGEGEA